MLVLVLLIIAAVIFGLDFLAGPGREPRNYATWRFGSLALCLVSVAHEVWHHGG